MVLIVASSFSIFSYGQGAVMTKYFEKFADNEDFTKVSVSSKMFSLFTEIEGSTEDEKEFLDAISKLKGMKAVVGEDVASSESKKLYTNATSDVDKEGYEELMTVTDAKENVKIAIKESGGIIEELVLVVGGKSNFALISLFGEIDLKKISKLASSMRVEGMKHLKNLHDLEEDEKEN